MSEKISKKRFHFRKNAKGFSLLEVLLALFVLSIGILGMLTLITDSIVNSAQSRDVITASQIAHEGVELVKWVRDNNIKANPSLPDDFFAGFPPGDSVCRIDYRAGSFDCTIPDIASSYVLYYNDIDGNGPLAYSHYFSGGGQTTFSRKIYIETPSLSPDERIIRSFVFWGSGWASAVPANDAKDCWAIKKCVYSEVKLTKRGN